MAQGLDLSELDFAAGRFRPVALLGQGAMGIVYRVVDTETATEIALKTLHERAPEEILTLKREFRSLADIAHPNLVELYELFVDDRACFFTMEFVDGSDAVSAVRGDSGPRLPLREEQIARVVDLARQLAAGLVAVHQAGKLHRDVKPSNIQVGADGRLVLLDFGLAIALRERFTDSSSSGGGSLAYMAPEQAWGRAPHPSADWYSTGVLLYEMLTGILPFRGPVARMFQDKSRGHFEPLTSAAPWAPAFLADLTMALLQPDPLTRPGAEEILRRLEVSGAARATMPSGLPPFVGRDKELEDLQAAAQTVRSGEAAAVEISGASGIGKSELVHRFFALLDDPQALILHGRCHPQETVPYKALDPILDDLSRFLLSEPHEEVERLLPANAWALAQLFPVLGRVPSFARAVAVSNLAPSQLRRRGFLALRELLQRVAERRLLVLWIDDLQWSDSDSALLLRELIRPPGAPPFLLLLSYRERDRTHIPLFGLLEEEKLSLPNGRRLPLEPLTLDESEELLRRLCGDQLAPASYASAARESHGSPFFLAQLAFHTSGAAPGAPAAPRELSIGDVLEARMATLSEPAQGLLETISIAGRPVLRGVALEAAGLSERQRPLLLQLERGHFVRSTAIAGETAVEAYHDRIRESVLERLPPARTRTRHLDIARVLSRLPERDPQQLFTHYLGGEDRVNARQFGEEAADRTARALAFDRAIDLYRQVLDLQDDEEARARLTAKLAEQFGNTGRGMESAQAYEQAAGALQRLGAEDSAIVGLKSKAAEQYLRVGRLEQGVASLRPVLASLGVELPGSRGRVVARAVQQRFRAWRRGRAYELRSGEDVPPELLQRLDLCWGSAMAIAAMDPVVADVLCTRHMMDALDAGVATHIIKALTHDAVTCAQFGSRMMRKRVDALMREADALNERTGDPFDKAVYQTALGGVFYIHAEWRSSHENCERALAIMRERFPWLSFEIATFDCWSLTALAQMGELRSMGQRLRHCIEDAEERNDLYSAIGFRTGALNLAWLAEDRVEEAVSGVETVMALWPDEGFHVQHYLALIARVQTALYRGDAGAAWRTVEGMWPRVRNSGWLRLDGAGIDLDSLRGRAALALATAPDPGASPAPDRAALLREAHRHATSLARRKLKTARPLATLLRAGLAEAESKRDEARTLYASADGELARLDMGLHAAVARLREGQLAEGGDGQAAVDGAREWMRRQEILHPERMAQVFAPTAVGSR